MNFSLRNLYYVFFNPISSHWPRRLRSLLCLELFLKEDDIFLINEQGFTSSSLLVHQGFLDELIGQLVICSLKVLALDALLSFESPTALMLVVVASISTSLNGIVAKGNASRSSSVRLIDKSRSWDRSSMCSYA